MPSKSTHKVEVDLETKYAVKNDWDASLTLEILSKSNKRATEHKSLAKGASINVMGSQFSDQMHLLLRPVRTRRKAAISISVVLEGEALKKYEEEKKAAAKQRFEMRQRVVKENAAKEAEEATPPRVAEALAAPVKKKYACDMPDCEESFDAKKELTKHLKAHEDEMSGS